MCFGFGGDLVSISDEKELDFVYKLSFKDTSDPVWIGLAYWFQKSTYFWSNGTSFNNSVSQSWFGSIPSNVSENKCVEISRNGSNITDCCKKNPRFICERAKGELSPWGTLLKNDGMLVVPWVGKICDHLRVGKGTQHENEESYSLIKKNWLLIAIENCHHQLLYFFLKFVRFKCTNAFKPYSQYEILEPFKGWNFSLFLKGSAAPTKLFQWLKEAGLDLIKIWLNILHPLLSFLFTTLSNDLSVDYGSSRWGNSCKWLSKNQIEKQHLGLKSSQPITSRLYWKIRSTINWQYTKVTTLSKTTPWGRYFKNIYGGVCSWKPGTLNLYQT